MAREFKRSYKFALKTSLFLMFFLVSFSALLLHLSGTFSWLLLTIYALSCFVISFVIIQYRVENFIYNRFKKIYDNVRIKDAEPFEPGTMSTDMASLTREVEKFTEGKNLEIETLKIRDSYRKEFMGNMAHELKTPLFTVQGYILTLLNGAHKDKSVRKKYLKRAGKGVERLIYIVKDLEMINNLETGGLDLNFEKFDIVEVVQEVFELLEMKAAKKEISFSFATQYEPVWVYGDIERIQQVVSNLLVNSIKYGKKGGNTSVTIEESGKGKIIIRVMDNGEGIKTEHLPRLFERFYRIDKSGSRKEGGSGLGLSIVKHILEAHREKIAVKSVFGVGSEFSFGLKKFERDLQPGRTRESRKT